ncbi:hypothetical protein HDA32_000809 [Spinactinospora alkalitolerans]|uniref:Uncharacterized protein n=1 Tax=Spinactinospora alkalitolerans TaxID=687207 RepID=A0A852TNY2_9ACTN|nr:hypothetical protein [Spinactinospora alkalitolerans]NYE45689.1 hypothetical protein [Spinactinospora alkalitolerans]
MDEVTLAIAAAVAGKVGESLTESAKDALKRLRRVLRERFRGTPDAQAALEAAQDDPDDQAAVRELAEHITVTEVDDAEVKGLTDELRPHFSAGDVVNTVNGDVSGNVVQARDIHGGIRL